MISHHKFRIASVVDTAYNEKPHNMYALLNIISIIKSRRIKWEGHLVHMRMRDEYNIIIGDVKRRENLGELDVDGRITLKWMLRYRMQGCGPDTLGKGYVLVKSKIRLPVP